MRTSKGFPLVLTADRVLMANYPTLLDGMFAASQTTAVPAFIMRRFVAPPVGARGLRAEAAPLGLRLVEASLLKGGFSVDDVAVVSPELLKHAIGPATRAVLVSSGDPLGLGMNDSTMSGIGGGRPFAPIWFEAMMRELTRMKVQHGFRIIFGGPGAWQLEQDPDARRRLGIDSVFLGYAEGDIAQIVAKVCAGGEVETLHVARSVPVDGIPPIAGPTIMGVVEVSRGCGLGCPFCTLAAEPMLHMPIWKILSDVETNVAGGMTSVSLVSEDILRYGSSGGRLAPDRLLELVRAVRSVRMLRLIQLDHVNVSSAARFPLDALAELRRILVRGTASRMVWVNLGVETASGDLLASASCRGKLHPFMPNEWEDVCEEAVRRLLAAGFVPMLSLILGLPGETDEHVRRTWKFVRRLRGQRVLVFPVFYAPVRPGGRAFGIRDMGREHWRLFRESYEFNFRWLPALYRDNHAGAGVPGSRRLFVQVGGLIKSVEWWLRIRLKSARKNV